MLKPKFFFVSWNVLSFFFFGDGVSNQHNFVRLYLIDNLWFFCKKKLCDSWLANLLYTCCIGNFSVCFCLTKWKEKLKDTWRKSLGRGVWTFPRGYLPDTHDDGWFYHIWLMDQTVKTEAPLLSPWSSLVSKINLNRNNCLHGCDLSSLKSKQLTWSNCNT